MKGSPVRIRASAWGFGNSGVDLYLLTIMRSAERAAAVEARFEKPLIVAALFVIPSVILTSVNIAEPWATVGQVLNWLTWAVFAIEFAVMLHVSPSRKQYMAANPLDVVIVFFTFPLLSVVFQTLRILRLLQLLRLLRLKPIVGWLVGRGVVKYAALLTLLVAVAGGYAFSEVESVGMWQGFYWATTTMTTVGYGSPPITNTETEVLAMVMLAVGITFIAIFTGSLAQIFIQGTVATPAQAEEVLADEQELLNQVKSIRAQLQSVEDLLSSRSGAVTTLLPLDPSESSEP